MAGCRVFDESLLDDDCDHSVPPERSGIIDDRADIGERFYVLHEIILDQGTRWSTIGFDLDGLCTVGPNPIVECTPSDASAPAEPDGEGGIDNVFGRQIIPLFTFLAPGQIPSVTVTQEKGLGDILIRIRGWNGEDNDSQVDVALSQTIFGTPGEPDGDPPVIIYPSNGIIYVSDPAPKVPLPPFPRFDGNDYFWVRETNFVGADPERPRIHDDRAYVRDGTLVVTPPERFRFEFSGADNGLVIQLTDASLTARLSPDHSRIEEAIVGGRWSAVDLLDTARSLGVCPGTPAFLQALRLLSLAADIRDTPGSGGPGVECNAVSVGMSFTGVQAKLGGLTRFFTLPDPCAE